MQQHFINKATEKFKYKFDYSLVNYITAKTKVKIICPIHGVFEQTPDKHLQSKHGCPLCWTTLKGKSRKGKSIEKPPKTVDTFLKDFYDKHPSGFSLDTRNYIGYTKGSVDVTCDKHGTTETMLPRVALKRKYPCCLCSQEGRNLGRTKSYDDFLEKSKTTFEDFYSYPESNKDVYQNRKSIVSIICPKHGVFNKRAQKHLSGQGCFRCTVEKLIEQGILLGGYSLKYFEDNPEKKSTSGTLYYLKVGDCYKIGITTDLPKRLKSIKRESKSDIMLLWKIDTTLYQAFLEEQEILSTYSHKRVYKDWSTELFVEDVLGKEAHSY